MTAQHIAYLTSVYPAPSHTFIRREVEALRAQGIAIDTFSIRRPDAGARLATPDQEALRTTDYLLPTGPFELLKNHLFALGGRPVAYLSTLRKALGHRPPGSRGLLWSLFYFAEAIMLAAKLKARGITHLHNHFANSGADVGMLASHFLNIPWSLTLHGSADWAYPAGYLLAEKIKAAAFVACVSNYGRSQAMRISHPAYWRKIFIARCGIELSVFPKSPHGHQRSQPLRIVTVGRLSPEKGQLGLIEAFAATRAKGVEAHLRIIGDGPLREQLEAMVSDLDLQDHCILAGQQPEDAVLEELAKADIFVLSSFLEGLPVVLMEALAMQVPVIAPCVAGIPELVLHGDTGLLFNTGDWQDLAEKIAYAAANPDQCIAMAAKGRRLVVELFDINRAIEPKKQRFLSGDPGNGTTL
ncbi:glycosyltransferase family 4 protein [Desulfurivibrio alkaliphilus]|uniref:Glycosyl transferase group 1 n=1 Tax=Desulfurivibrio alkaliphilus (strain DSM 19089 / UNIQEM U267 / AHT2) TaxID=589865 RepID=D6Z4G4_DESAT|nr:glycosyltransferase family 4 protein [Desulfurivibrio alkaliphilus]ADH86439.1 glycosyl transferase group 1 [Desulfurivibrio alkaliphilus AHT 2]